VSTLSSRIRIRYNIVAPLPFPLLKIPRERFFACSHRFQHTLSWLCSFTPKGSFTASQWYECIPHGKIILKKSKDNPAHKKKHDLLWFEELFLYQCNMQNADSSAMLGGVHLELEADPHMASNPSVPLSEAWYFLSRKVGFPFLSVISNNSPTVLSCNSLYA